MKENYISQYRRFSSKKMWLMFSNAAEISRMQIENQSKTGSLVDYC